MHHLNSAELLTTIFELVLLVVEALLEKDLLLALLVYLVDMAETQVQRLLFDCFVLVHEKRAVLECFGVIHLVHLHVGHVPEAVFICVHQQIA